jgi:hypothetical protein
MTVEELRGLLRCFIIGESDRHDIPLVLSQLDVALDLSHAEGVAEGCMKEKEEQDAKWLERIQTLEGVLERSSVLAPPKEKP